MDKTLRAALDRVALTASNYADAVKRRNPDQDWLTINERSSLADLRAALAALDREEHRKTRGRAA